MKSAVVQAILVFCFSVSMSATADSYLTTLLTTVSESRTNLGALTKSADAAAARFVAGGKLWVTGRQEDLIAEACGRAGGLMASSPLHHESPTNQDVILYAVPGALTAEDRKLTRQWQDKGALVITFSSTAGLYINRFPVDTVMNVVDVWTWTGEFVAACTRLGKMPVIYQSYGLPGGPARAKKYEGKRFHDDLTIKPIPPETLGWEYREQLERLLTKVRDTQLPKIVQAARWWGEADSGTTLFTGHMFPRHVQDTRAPDPGKVATVAAWEDKELLDATNPPKFVLYVGYQFAPRKLIAQAKTMGVKLVYFDVQPGEPAEPEHNVLYIDPAWPLADGCVSISGYDIPILPASGVIDAAIYWTIASEHTQ